MLARPWIVPRPSGFLPEIDMRYRLTPEIEGQVLSFIRAGGFDWVAAEAAGIPREVLERWLAQGARQGRQPYRRFYQNVIQARAQARTAAEIKARDKDPRFWLKHGPGRERPGYPGWTNPAPAGPVHAENVDGTLDSPASQALLACMLQVVEGFPDTRERLIEAVQKLNAKWRMGS